MNINLNFNDKEQQVIALMVQGKTLEELTNIVMRSWFDSNMERTYAVAKTQVEKIDEIIAVKAAEQATVDNIQPVDTPVV